MDTDSAYMALSGDIHKIIKPNLKLEFYTNYDKWFPRIACSDHQQDFISAMMNNQTWTMIDCCKKVNKYDQRTPGLFKEEFVGHGIISLNSKTYYCWNNDSDKEDKYRSKGLSRKQNKLTKDQFFSVLNTRKPVSGTNHGFLKKDRNILTYSQERNGLTYVYTKRLVMDDGVSTLPLAI